MIPLSLELRDFLSYEGPALLDLSGFDVACLSGDNGAGKSALLDAITWACWGAARGCESGQHQERLIRDGADETSVTFTFELNGARHRIIRRRARAGKSDVRFQIADGDSWTNLGGETLRETDARIASTLRMDYTTFTASALFVQGRSDDFLRMTPSGRREVFAQLLGLEAYELLAEAARSRARDAGAVRLECSRSAERLAGAPAERKEAEREVASARARSAEAQSRADAAGAAVAGARAQLVDLEKQQAALPAEEQQLALLERTIEQLQADLGSRSDDLDRMDAVIVRADEVRERMAELAALKRADDEARVRRDQAAEARRLIAQLTERIEAERRQICARCQTNAGVLAGLEAEISDMDELARRLAEVGERLDGAPDPRIAIDRCRAATDEARSAGVRLEEQVRSIGSRLEDLDRRSRLLEGGGGECPLCGTALDAAHRRRVARALDEESRELRREDEQARAALETVIKESARGSEELARLERALREHEELTAARTDLSARLERRQSIEDRVAEVVRDIDGDERTLRDETFAESFRAELSAAQASLRDIYDAADHERVGAAIKELAPYEALAVRLAEAVEHKPRIASEIGALHERLASVSADRDDRARRVAELAALTGPVEQARAEAARLDAEHAEALAEASAAASGVVLLEERCRRAEREMAELERALVEERAAATEQRRYERLAHAFGRNGIPQLIIENERPQLEHEANRILGRLSEDPMTVQLQFSRETKSGKPRETLDVVVRPYDGQPREFAMFSGGEAFRIAFAVRLAMSKLLVRRAGARLETLVIDEGFGSQDPQGRERLVEAINLARKEFRKVLVITHLDDLKDQFGTQIVVGKGPGGSVFELARS